jgi:hypothetical protein
LQKLFEGLYGPTPQIDLDAQVARARVPRPVPIDLSEVAAGVVRNNVGVDAIRLWVRGRLEKGEVAVDGTGQRFPVEGAPSATTKPWFGFDASGYEPGSSPVLRWIGEADMPGGTVNN